MYFQKGNFYVKNVHTTTENLSKLPNQPNIGSTNSVRLGRGYQFVRPMEYRVEYSKESVWNGSFLQFPLVTPLAQNYTYQPFKEIFYLVLVLFIIK